MSNKCAGCGRVYDSYAIELIKGCDCGSSLFIYQRSAPVPAVRAKPVPPRVQSLGIPSGAAPGPAAFEVDPKEVVKKIETAFVAAAKEGRTNVDDVEFDPECIRVIEDGVYDINVAKLVRKEPLIVEIKEDGRYFVHLASIFKKVMEVEDDALEVNKKSRRKKKTSESSF